MICNVEEKYLERQGTMSEGQQKQQTIESGSQIHQILRYLNTELKRIHLL